MAEKTIFGCTLVLRNKTTDKFEFMPGASIWCSWNSQIYERFYMIPISYHEIDVKYKNRARTKEQFLDYVNNSALLHHMTKKALAEKLESVVTGEAS